MSIEDPKEYNRQAKIDKYESQIDKQCSSIGFILMTHNIDSTFKDQFAIAEMENNHGVDMQEVDLDLYSTVEEVIDAMDWMR